LGRLKGSASRQRQQVVGPLSVGVGAQVLRPDLRLHHRDIGAMPGGIFDERLDVVDGTSRSMLFRVKRETSFDRH
jgi:hypothetical protein